jgi:hypothetical protein
MNSSLAAAALAVAFFGVLIGPIVFIGLRDWFQEWARIPPTPEELKEMYRHVREIGEFEIASKRDDFDEIVED